MNDSRKKLQHNTNEDCHAFQAHLPELFESEADIGQHPHLATCAACSALVRDLEYIAAQAKLLLPLHDPSPAVWENIQSALNKSGGNSKGNA
ncbi:MAG TPA: hypothetical protein VMU62_09975 [Acidobacteriaceae bacterium]|nr:hypothetical protein [Acidobacteriaceae bacterium]